MFKEWTILNLSHYGEVVDINNRWSTIALHKKSEGYNEQFSIWIKNFLDPNVSNCHCVGYFLDDKLIGYYTFIILEYWPFAYHDHWRANPDLKTKSIKYLTSAVPEFHDYLLSRGIHTWFSISGKELWHKYQKVRNRFLPNDIESSIIEEIPAGEKSKYMAFDKYFIQGQVYSEPMYVMQHISKKKFS